MWLFHKPPGTAFPWIQCNSTKFLESFVHLSQFQIYKYYHEIFAKLQVIQFFAELLICRKKLMTNQRFAKYGLCNVTRIKKKLQFKTWTAIIWIETHNVSNFGCNNIGIEGTLFLLCLFWLWSILKSPFIRLGGTAFHFSYSLPDFDLAAKAL